jgi:hypothetical protein
MYNNILNVKHKNRLDAQQMRFHRPNAGYTPKGYTRSDNYKRMYMLKQYTAEGNGDPTW